MNVMPVTGPGIQQHKCLPPTPINGTLPMQYNMVDMVPQQIRQRVNILLLSDLHILKELCGNLNLYIQAVA